MSPEGSFVAIHRQMHVPEGTSFICDESTRIASKVPEMDA
jgi:hypothetical protein